MFNKLTKTLLFLAAILLVAAVFSFTPDQSPKEINVWHKVSDDELNPGEIIPLDMSRGYSFCAGTVIYLVVNALDSGDEIVIAFPDGGYWKAPEPDPFLEELQNEFDNLEEYLRSKGSNEWKKQ